mmetsp:Transcript_154230/g.287520  ORF Transcript_154230/g.287520 Transcript_154230/m.287520 type:complete len:221 (-) Transcript_154230:120-782(-)
MICGCTQCPLLSKICADIDHCTLMTFQSANVRSSFNIPDAQLTVDPRTHSARCQRYRNLERGAETHAHVILGEHGKTGHRFKVPNSQTPVHGAADSFAMQEACAHREHSTSMPFQAAQAAQALQIPDTQREIARGTNSLLAGNEICTDGVNAVPVSMLAFSTQCAHAASRQVTDSEAAILHPSQCKATRYNNRCHSRLPKEIRDRIKISDDASAADKPQL